MLKNSRTPLSEKLQKMCGQKQKNMWSKLKKNTAKKTVCFLFAFGFFSYNTFLVSVAEKGMLCCVR
jgi:hypothetical protein